MIDYQELYYDEEDKIRELLLFRKIVEVKGDSLYLDNNVKLTIYPNCGGCGCDGWYEIEELNNCENAITNIEFVEDEYDGETSYKIFVLANDERIKILQVDGYDGNGWYGTGYSIIVTMKE